MKRIKKDSFRIHFDGYSRRYLHDTYNELEKEFFPRLTLKEAYNCFSNKRYKYERLRPDDRFDGWLSILMEESVSRCCYCMRRLREDEVSVEHLVPESFDKLVETEEMDFYYKYAPYLKVNLMTGREFDELAAREGIDIDKHTRMPHLVAHANLFPACKNDVGCSCNNGRGNHRILPLMLMDDIDSFLIYNEEGNVILRHKDTEAARETLTHLDLNSGTLLMIRRLWYLFSRKDIRPHEAEDRSFRTRDSLIRRAYGLGELEVIPSESMHFVSGMGENVYWNLMLKYDWFFDYYLTHYPPRH